MGAMPTVDGSPMCIRHGRVLEDLCRSFAAPDVERGWCESGRGHWVYDTDSNWGREAIPLDQYVRHTHNIEVLPMLFCRQCASKRPARVFEDGGHTCMACGLSQDPSEPTKEE